jgi:hypothetical protein
MKEKCPESHDEIRASLDLFLSGKMKNHRAWPEEGLLLAECASCGSTLSLRVSEVPEEVSAG